MTNEQLDAAVLKEIRREPQTFRGLRATLSKDLNIPAAKLYRAIDRALQRLRKEGKIEYRLARWWRVAS